MYNVILWKDNDNEDIHVFENKPTFSELYKLIGCDLIEIIQGYNDEDKTFDMYSDEEAKLLDRCLKSVHRNVDEICITITGKNKACSDVVKKYKGKESYFEW